MNQPPTDLTLSSSTFTSHSESGTVVGSFATADPNPGDTFTYMLVHGSGSEHNADFAIVGTELKVVNSDLWPGFYSVRVRSTDERGEFLEKSFSLEAVFGELVIWWFLPFLFFLTLHLHFVMFIRLISANPMFPRTVNQRPSDLILSSLTFTSHSQEGTVVGTFTTVDPNPGDVFTYSLVNGSSSDNNVDFFISGAQLLVANSDLWPGSYTIRIRSTDAGGMFVEKVFSLKAIFGKLML